MSVLTLLQKIVQASIRDRAAKSRSVQASIRYSETLEKIVVEHATETKAALTTGFTGDAYEAEAHMAGLYYKMRDHYFRSYGVKFPTTFNNKSIALWHRVVDACKTADVTPEDYMRAQFEWFHRVFGRPPKVYQLATDAAILRVPQATKTSGNVVGNDIQHKIGTAEMFKQCDRQLAAVCRAQCMTREEVYSKLVFTGLIPFPKAFLDADPVYKKVCDARR